MDSSESQLLRSRSGRALQHGGFSLVTHDSVEGEVDRPLRDLQVMISTTSSLLALLPLASLPP